MLTKLHMFLGLDGDVPSKLKKLGVPVIFASVFVVLAIRTVPIPEHVAFIRAEIVALPTGTRGAIAGEAVQVRLPSGEVTYVYTEYRLPEARPGAYLCLNHSENLWNGRRMLSVTIGSRCSGETTATTYSLDES